MKSLFDGSAEIDGTFSSLKIADLIYATCRGGWPRTFYVEDPQAKLLIAQDYLQQICKKDASSIDGVQRNSDWVKAILKSYARNTGTLAKKNTIQQDVFSNFKFSDQTFDEYVDALRELYVISDLDAWTPQLRSKNAIRKPIKHLFYDPSIAVAALEVSPEYFLQDFDLFGHIFESLVYRDLLVYSQPLHGSLSHYHDANNLEVDFVLHLGDGRYALIEVKLGSREINEGVKHLLKVKRLIQENNMDKNKLPLREPDVLMIITGGEMAYTQEGVSIVPIGCLKD
ncbi:MAG: ATP-binding protein [Candidatus Enteromonas sp.]